MKNLSGIWIKSVCEIENKKIKTAKFIENPIIQMRYELENLK